MSTILLDPHATIDRAAVAAERSLGAERSARGLITVQVKLAQELAHAFGRELDDGEAAGFVVLCARLALPVLDADVLAAAREPAVFTPADAANLTACIGVNLLEALRASAPEA